MDKSPCIKPSALNLTEENMGNTLELTGARRDFPNRTPIIQALRTTANKWDFLKLRNFCTVKDIIIWTKWQLIEWENIFFYQLQIH